jgi:hypothetical protein
MLQDIHSSIAETREPNVVNGKVKGKNVDYHMDIDEPSPAPEGDDNETTIPVKDQDKSKAVKVQQDRQERIEDDNMDYSYDEAINQNANNTVEMEHDTAGKEISSKANNIVMHPETNAKAIHPHMDDEAAKPNASDKVVSLDANDSSGLEESAIIAMEKQPSVVVETLDELPPVLTTDEAVLPAMETVEEMAQEQQEVNFHFEDDGIDYGYDEQETFGPVEAMDHAIQVPVKRPYDEIEKQVEDPLIEARKVIKDILQGRPSKRARNLANAHIIGLQQVSLDTMKEAK